MTADNLLDFYQVDDYDHPIKLAVDIGYGKDAFIIVLLNKKIIYGSETENVFVKNFEKVLGSGAELFGKNMQLIALVFGGQQKLFETSLMVSLTGGLSTYTQRLESYSPETQGIVKYSIGIRFCK